MITGSHNPYRYTCTTKARARAHTQHPILFPNEGPPPPPFFFPLQTPPSPE